MPKKKKPYFPNNVEAYRGAPSEWFAEIPYDEFMDWKVGGWELPATCNYLIRERNLSTGKVKEYAYRRPSAAKKKLEQRMQFGNLEFTVCDDDAVHLLRPQEEDYDDPLA